MKTLTLYLALSFICLYSFSQPYIPTVVKGRTWASYQPMGLGQFIIGFSKLSCDTQINSYIYLKKYYCDTFGTNANYSGMAIREDTTNHKVYAFDTNTGNDSLLIDYDISVGGTYNGMTVDSITYKNLFGQMRKVIHFDQPYKWIEGIGNSFKGLSYTGTFTPFSFSQVYAVYATDSLCTPLAVSTYEFPFAEIKQTGASFFIKTTGNNSNVRVFNTYGQLLLQKSFHLSTEENLSMFSNQLLILEIYTDEKRYIKKIFVP